MDAPRYPAPRIRSLSCYHFHAGEFPCDGTFFFFFFFFFFFLKPPAPCMTPHGESGVSVGFRPHESLTQIARDAPRYPAHESGPCRVITFTQASLHATQRFFLKPPAKPHTVHDTHPWRIGCFGRFSPKSTTQANCTDAPTCPAPRIRFLLCIPFAQANFHP